jgi:SAM-dependent methyltransferase
MMELLVGAGASREKKVKRPGDKGDWTNLVTLDMYENHGVDVVHDLRVRPLPFPDDTFNEIHAYDVLEHLGQQGDFVSFFAEWSEWWRILKPGGHMFAISPHWSSPWAWGDPGHTRVYGPECISFLDQTEYQRQIGVSPMTDYRSIYKADFEPVFLKVEANRQFVYVLKAHKPIRGD